MLATWRHRYAIRAGGLLAALMVFMSSGPASAEGLFDFLFGGGFRRPAPPAASSFVNPLDSPDSRLDLEEKTPVVSGPPVAYCVRLCDGHYFPIQHQAGVSPARICSAFCPAAKTRIFTGGVIDRAIAADGSRYTDLGNAFVYRDRLMPNCSCNGKDPLGLAHVDIRNDPTLRPGDIVAGANGLMTYRGQKNQVSEFTPVDRSAIQRNRRNKQPESTTVTSAPRPIQQ